MCVRVCVRLEMVNTWGIRTVLILTRSAIKFHSLVAANLRRFKFLSSRAKIRWLCGRERGGVGEGSEVFVQVV